MADARGFATRFGFEREAITYAKTWPSAAAIAATDLIPVRQEAVQENIEFAAHEELEGKGGYRPASVVARRYNGPIIIDPVPYQGLEAIWACAMGYEANNIGGTDMPEELEVGAYRHLFELDAHLTDRPWQAGDGFTPGDLTTGARKVRRGTLAMDKQVSVWEFRSNMFNGFTLRGSPDKVEMELPCVAYDLDLASAINTTGVMEALSRVPRQHLVYSDMTLWIADYSAGTPLDSGDAVQPSSFEVTLGNNLIIDRHSTSNGLYIDSPERDGNVSISGAFQFPRYSNNTFLSDLRADTQKMMRLKFTGAIIGATSTNYSLTLWFPHVKFTEVSTPVGGPGLLPVTHAFTAYKPDAAAAGFPTDVKDREMLIEVVSAVSTNPLL